MVDLDELERLEREATPGPWEADTEEVGDCVVWGPAKDGEEDSRFVSNIGRSRIGAVGVAFDHDADDCRLIAAARNALPDLLAELRTLRATIKDAWETLGGEWKGCDATLGEAIAAELGEYDEANPEALSATLRENARLRARVAEMEADREAAFVALCLPPEARECWAVETLEDGVDLVNGWDKEQYAAYEQRIAKLERDARLGAAVREAAGTFGPSEVESVEDITISDDGEPDGCREVIIISDEQASILSEIADALRAEEGGEHG